MSIRVQRVQKSAQEFAQSIDRNQIIYPVAFLVVFVTFWTAFVELFELPQYLLPKPWDIVVSFEGRLDDLWPHIRLTLFEALFGWVVGNVIGITLGLVMAESRALRTSFYPYLIALRSIPVIAIAPLLILWLGINIRPILATAVIIVFFPTLVNCIAGFTSTDQLTHELMHSLDASRWQVFRYVKIYNALPYIMSSLKITVALSLIGAVVGEWLVADAGLGFLIVVANNQINTLLMFRAILILGLMGTTWFVILSFIEQMVISWESVGQEGGVR